MIRFIDGLGVAFADHRLYLPAQVWAWRQPERVKSPKTLRLYSAEWGHCQVCGRFAVSFLRIETHHIIGGSKGRSDERTNLIRLCRECHSNANSAHLPKGVILWCKWRTDRQNTDWLRLALLHRAFLPDLVPDRRLAATYKANRLGVPQ